MSDCIFCKITKKEIPSDILRETNEIVIFKDIRPSAPVHYLVVPKEHIASIKEISADHCTLVGALINEARTAAEQLGLAGYKLVFNVGKEGGQIIDHIHLHLLGGWKK